MKIFVTIPFETSKERIEEICSLVRKAGFEDFCFIRDVEHYQEIFDDSRKLMQRAKEEIEKCDALLVDVSKKSGGGRFIEAGIAYSLNKKIIIIAKKGTKIKETVEGISDVIIEYEKILDILPKLKKFRENENN